MPPDPLSNEVISCAPPIVNCGAQIRLYKSIDSTNAELKRLLSCNSSSTPLDRTVIIAEEQTAGRGRAGRSFISPAGAGIYLSLLHSPSGGVSSPQIITAITAVAVCRAIEKVYGIEAKIKWVNDIFVRGKKACGILAEAASLAEGAVSSVIIGIGVNILPGALPPSLDGVAGSVLQDAASAPRLNDFAIAIIAGVFGLLASASAYPILQEYRTRSFLIGKQVAVHPLPSGESFSATVLGIADDASLVVRTEDSQVRHLNSGEVTLGSSSIGEDYV